VREDEGMRIEEGRYEIWKDYNPEGLRK